MDKPHPTGPRSENPYCSRCGKHLALSFHETNEHDEAKARTELHAEEAITALRTKQRRMPDHWVERRAEVGDAIDALVDDWLRATH